MKYSLYFLFHSSYVLLTDKRIFVFDFYFDYEQKSRNLLKSILDEYKNLPIVFINSHSHHDHFSLEIFEEFKGSTFVISKECFNKYKKHYILPLIEKGENIITLRALEEKDLFDDVKIKAFASTDIGLSFAICILGIWFFHAGDFNFWHWKDESTEQEIKQASDLFHKILKTIVDFGKEYEVVMFPVDPRMGTDYELGALEFIKKVKLKYFAPMHFWGNFTLGNKITKEVFLDCSVIKLDHNLQLVLKDGQILKE